ncbi:MAG TPA: C39 family peptidase [Terriglobia bacterium]
MIRAALLVLQAVQLAAGLWLDVPFVHQSKNGCGSASIWMVMQYWKHPATPDVENIQRRLYSKPVEGIYARDMERYLKEHGFQVFTFNAGWDDLAAHISKGRPLIVCLERNAHGIPLHYVVVVGVDSAQDLVWMNDPAERKLVPMRRGEFEADWKATDNWTLLALPIQEAGQTETPPPLRAALDPSELELASAAFRTKDFAGAEQHLKSVLRARPEDEFANDFLAASYLLDGNLDAALKYWNRVGKPRLRGVRIDPPLRIDPVLLDHTFAFSRAAELDAREYDATRARLDALGIFPRYHFELTPADGDDFDITLHASERNGANYLAWLRGMPYQTVYPAWWNLRRRAINIESLVRWDAQKKRVNVSLTSPLRLNSSLSYRINLDARDENWQLPTAGFNMKRAELSGSTDAILNDAWTWTNGAALTRRSFTNAYTGGRAISYNSGLRHSLLKVPEKRLTIDSAISAGVGKFFAQPAGRFVQTQGDVSARWSDASVRLRGGKSFGDLPFDQLFVLGVDRDSDLRLRGHPATSPDGRKGAAPVTRDFILMNADFTRPLFDKSLFGVRAGPFLDAARIGSGSPWLVDSGVQLKVSVMAAFTFSVSAGWDVRGGSHALFIDSAR